MITPETLQHIGQGPAIKAASDAALAAADFLPLPQNFTLHDLEKLRPLRRRARGSMTTSNRAHFAGYIADHAEPGATVFVDPLRMQASAVLNLGNPNSPGHADNLAVYAPRITAAYAALLAIANGQAKSQQDVAEFLEDWGAGYIDTFHGDAEVPHRQAVAAIRKVTIESLNTADNSIEQLSTARSTFDRVKAVSDAGQIPTTLTFTCAPYVGCEARVFPLRLAILASAKAPAITLRIVKHEEHIEEMGAELAEDVTRAVLETVPVVIGGYVVKA